MHFLTVELSLGSPPKVLSSGGIFLNQSGIFVFEGTGGSST
jgi:hypothetical protein